jgi:hypothetical protein
MSKARATVLVVIYALLAVGLGMIPALIAAGQAA